VVVHLWRGRGSMAGRGQSGGHHDTASEPASEELSPVDSRSALSAQLTWKLGSSAMLAGM
jgi:hypothetical protein